MSGTGTLPRLDLTGRPAAEGGETPRPIRSPLRQGGWKGGGRGAGRGDGKRIAISTRRGGIHVADEERNGAGRGKVGGGVKEKRRTKSAF